MESLSAYSNAFSANTGTIREGERDHPSYPFVFESLFCLTPKESFLSTLPFSITPSDQMSDAEIRNGVEILHGYLERHGETALQVLSDQMFDVSYPFRSELAKIWSKSYGESWWWGYPDGKKLLIDALVKSFWDYVNGQNAPFDQKRVEEMARPLIETLASLQIGKEGALDCPSLREHVAEWCAVNRYSFSFQEGVVSLKPLKEVSNVFRSIYDALTPLDQAALAMRIHRIVFSTLLQNEKPPIAYRAMLDAQNCSIKQSLARALPYLLSAEEERTFLSSLTDEEAVAFAERLFTKENLALDKRQFLALVSASLQVPSPIQSEFAASWQKAWQDSINAKSFFSWSWPPFPEWTCVLREFLLERLGANAAEVVEHLLRALKKRDCEFKPEKLTAAAAEGCFERLREWELIESFAACHGIISYRVGKCYQTEIERIDFEADAVRSKMDENLQEVFCWCLVKAYEQEKSSKGRPLEIEEFSTLRLSVAKRCFGGDITSLLTHYFVYDQEKWRTILANLPVEERYQFILLLDRLDAFRLKEGPFLELMREAASLQSIAHVERYISLEIPCRLIPFSEKLEEFKEVLTRLPFEEQVPFAELYARKDLGLDLLGPDAFIASAGVTAREVPEERYARLRIAYAVTTNKQLGIALHGMSIQEQARFCAAVEVPFARMVESEREESIQFLKNVPPAFRLPIFLEWCTKRASTDSVFVILNKIIHKLPKHVIVSWCVTEGGMRDDCVLTGEEVGRRLIRSTLDGEKIVTIASLLKSKKYVSFAETRSLRALIDRLIESGLLSAGFVTGESISIERCETFRDKVSDGAHLSPPVVASRLTADLECSEIAYLHVVPIEDRLKIIAEVRGGKPLRELVHRYLLGKAGISEKLLNHILERAPEGADLGQLIEIMKAPSFAHVADIVLDILPLVEDIELVSYCSSFSEFSREEAKKIASQLKEHAFWEIYRLEDRVELLNQVKSGTISEADFMKLGNLQNEGQIETILAMLKNESYIKAYSFDEKSRIYSMLPQNV